MEAALVVRPQIVSMEFIAGEIFRVRQHIADLHILPGTRLDVRARGELREAHAYTEDRSAVVPEQTQANILAGLEIQYGVALRQPDRRVGKLRNLLARGHRLTPIARPEIFRTLGMGLRDDVFLAVGAPVADGCGKRPVASGRRE